MTVDIIIPAYNCEDTINVALASVATQKLDNGDSLLVTIVNDKSTTVPNYNAFVEYWSALFPIQTIDKEENAGCGQARQTGVDETDGDYFMFLDADDVLGSPFAVRSLVREAKRGDFDVTMGTFIEEDGDGHINQHGENWIWCHGKLYKRRTIERFLLRFNLTRGNEDVGYHCVLNKLTDRTSYINQVVYIWQNQRGSLVRGNRDGYAYGYGWRDFVENMAWAAEELFARNINRALVRDHSVTCLVRIFGQYQESLKKLPAEKEETTAKVIDYYNRAVKPFVLEGAMPYEVIAAKYMTMYPENAICCVPFMTLSQFLEMLGYYNDRKEIVTDD